MGAVTILNKLKFFKPDSEKIAEVVTKLDGNPSIEEAIQTYKNLCIDVRKAETLMNKVQREFEQASTDLQRLRSAMYTASSEVTKAIETTIEKEIELREEELLNG